MVNSLSNFFAMNSWFTVKVKYTKQLDDGTFKRVSEPYLIAAMTFSDAETRIYEELGMSIRGEFVVNGIARTDIHEIFYYEDADTWYKCKITYEAASDNPDEGGKAKKISQNMLVSAHSVKEAYERIKESLKGMMMDYMIPSISISPIVDIFPFNDSGEDVAGKELERQLKKDIAEAAKAESEHSLGRKTVFSAPGSDEDEDFGDEEDSVIDDQFGEEEE